MLKPRHYPAFFWASRQVAVPTADIETSRLSRKELSSGGMLLPGWLASLWESASSRRLTSSQNFRNIRRSMDRFHFCCEIGPTSIHNGNARVTSATETPQRFLEEWERQLAHNAAEVGQESSNEYQRRTIGRLLARDDEMRHVYADFSAKSLGLNMWKVVLQRIVFCANVCSPRYLKALKSKMDALDQLEFDISKNASLLAHKIDEYCSMATEFTIPETFSDPLQLFHLAEEFVDTFGNDDKDPTLSRDKSYTPKSPRVPSTQIVLRFLSASICEHRATPTLPEVAEIVALQSSLPHSFVQALSTSMKRFSWSQGGVIPDDFVFEEGALMAATNCALDLPAGTTRSNWPRLAREATFEIRWN